MQTSCSNLDASWRDTQARIEDIGLIMQVSFKKKAHAGSTHKNLAHLARGESGILDRLDLPEEDAQRLMEMGFLPGHSITRGHAAPGGDPRVFQVDGSEVALRRETALRLILR